MSAWASGPRAYILVFVILASGSFTTPALVVTAMGLRRVPESDRIWARSWFAGLVLTYAAGLAMLAGLATGWRLGNAFGGPLVMVISGLYITTIMGMVRSRSGRLAMTVDVLEGAMALVVVIAPCVLLWGETVLHAEADWFVIPAALALIAVVVGAYWSIVLYVRMGPGAGVIGPLGVVLTLVGSVDAAAHVAQGVSGFTLPAPPLIALHAVCMAMLLLVPLHLPRRQSSGLDRLPPQAQVRGGGLVALLTLVGVPLLLAAVAFTPADQGWAVPFALGAMGLLLVLGALRHLASVRETRRLYQQVERASAERRALLARLLRRADEDRHRVAAQLHEQAVSAYASFVSFLQACGPNGQAGATGADQHQHPAAGPGGIPSPLANASTLVRDDLARHADSLRHLMLAIQPLESEGAGEGGSDSLAAPIHAYLDSLYGDRRAPRLTVEVQDGVVLDWMTETIALRIIQEAVRNVWRHSEADNVDVWIGQVDGAVELRITDDGVGFDPDAALFESGIGAMRSFAAVLGGRAAVTSAPGEGTTVTARLGAARPAAPPDGAWARTARRVSGRAGRPAGQADERAREEGSDDAAARPGAAGADGRFDAGGSPDDACGADEWREADEAPGDEAGEGPSAGGWRRSADRAGGGGDGRGAGVQGPAGADETPDRDAPPAHGRDEPAPGATADGRPRLRLVWGRGERLTTGAGAGPGGGRFSR
ncbi:MAG TPA: ATP-binding protein [Acidimicrobiales bacterium]